MESKIFAKLSFDPGILVILSMILTIILIIAVIMLLLRQSRLEMNYKIFMKGKGGKSLEETFKQQLDNLDLIKEQTELLHKRMVYVEKSQNKSYQKCGIVRYDAFKELGGNLSFAYALLNDSNTGFVMNCIHSREGSYTYIKDVVRGECSLQISDEEAEAIQKAISAQPVAPVVQTTTSTTAAAATTLKNATNTIKEKVPIPVKKMVRSEETSTKKARTNDSEGSVTKNSRIADSEGSVTKNPRTVDSEGSATKNPRTANANVRK